MLAALAFTLLLERSLMPTGVLTTPIAFRWALFSDAWLPWNSQISLARCRREQSGRSDHVHGLIPRRIGPLEIVALGRTRGAKNGTS
jgi:hypothetical protein